MAGAIREASWQGSEESGAALSAKRIYARSAGKNEEVGELMTEIKVKLSTDPRNRTSVLESLASRLKELPLETAYTVNVDALQESRRVHQNALMWVWNAEGAQFYGEDNVYMHGLNKLKCLYPLMLSWDKHREAAMRFRDIVRFVTEPEAAYWLADQTLRTKNLTVKQFAEYLSAVQLYWGQQGLNLTTLVDEYDAAMGIKKAA